MRVYDLEELSLELTYLNKTTDAIIENLKSLDMDGLNSISYNRAKKKKKDVESVLVQTVELTEKTKKLKKLTKSIERAAKFAKKSKLTKYQDDILYMRKQGYSYRQIQECLREEYGVNVSAEMICCYCMKYLKEYFEESMENDPMFQRVLGKKQEGDNK